MVAETVLTQKNIEKILKGIIIPSPPQVVADLQMEMAMPDPDLDDMDYMLGLFHNTGIPLLMQRFADYPEVLAQSYLLEEHRIVDAENKHYKVEQCRRTVEGNIINHPTLTLPLKGGNYLYS